MKFIVLNSKINAEHSIYQAFLDKGWASIHTSDAQEFWTAIELHGKSIDLAIMKYEDIPHGFFERIKSNNLHQDLPLLITYESLTLQECAEHQKTPFGAHAYFEEPIEKEKLLGVINQIFGISFSKEVSFHSQVKLEMPEMTGEFKLDFDHHPHKEQDVPFLAIPHHDENQSISLNSPIRNEDELGSAFEKTKTLEEPHEIKKLESEEALVEEFPYLFDKFQNNQVNLKSQDPLMEEALSAEEIIPGGISENLDFATLKKYLELRERDVIVLSRQNKNLKEEYQKIKENLSLEKIRVNELEFTVKDLNKKLSDFQSEKEILKRTHEAEIEDLKILQKEKITKVKILEEVLSSQKEEQNKLKDRVRSDIRKIRMREKELENRLEILRRDSEALLGAREGKILELKRKLDLTEFNLDLLQEQNTKEKEKIGKLKEKLQRASQAMRLAGGFLGEEPSSDDSDLGVAFDESGKKIS